MISKWERQRPGVLRVQHSSLATAIELSLTSPLFRELGPDARGLLAVIAFFPQGINEEKTHWLLPTISDVSDVFDKFCILSLISKTGNSLCRLCAAVDVGDVSVMLDAGR